MKLCIKILTLCCVVLAVTGLPCFGVQILKHGDGKISKADNWTDRTLTAEDHYAINSTNAVVRSTDRFTLIGGDGTKLLLLIGTTGDGALTMDGGIMTVNGTLVLGQSSLGKKGVLNLSGGALMTVGDVKVAGGGTDSYGYINMSGGVLKAGRHLVVGRANSEADKEAVMNYTGGNVSADGQFQVVDGGQLNFRLGCPAIKAAGSRQGGGLIKLLFNAGYSHIVGTTNVLVSSSAAGAVVFNLITDSGAVPMKDGSAVTVNGHNFKIINTSTVLGLIAVPDSEPITVGRLNAEDSSCDRFWQLPANEFAAYTLCCFSSCQEIVYKGGWPCVI